MGLDMTVVRDTGRSVSFAYGFFATYRRALARDAAGIDLDAMRGYGGDREWPPHDMVPLRYLLEHSDCDGWLQEWECEELAPALRAFLPPDEWPRWMRERHDALTAIVLDVADNGGSIRFH